MNSDRQACGLGTLFPMSCRGRAEAFARSLHSRLQSLGRAGSGEAGGDDEKSWLTRQSQVTSHQPRLSSSSESDIYYDFDLECESPGSPEEAPAPDFPVNKSRVLHQLSSESGCFPSPSAVNVTDPGSDSSDGPYFDSVLTDTEIGRDALQQDDAFQDVDISSTMFYNGFVQGPVYKNLRHATCESSDDSNSRAADGAAFVPASIEAKVSTLDASIRRDNWKINSNEGSSNDEFFECDSPKAENSVAESLGSLCLHDDSGYPNTADTSRCNSQNETNSDTCGCRCSLMSENVFEINNNTENQTEEICSSACTSKTIAQQPSASDDDIKLCDNESAIESVEGDKTDATQKLEISHRSNLSRPSSLTIECPTTVTDSDAHKVADIHDKDDSNAEQQAKSDEDDELRATPRVRRCSSLKSGKTPPGTPGRKKIVRFADVLGLDLADVRTFLDEIPKVPKSAYEDLECADLSSSESPSFSMPPQVDLPCPVYIRRPEKSLIALFQQPGGLPDFMDRVRENQVCLENAVVSDAVSFAISGMVRVRNLDFHKSVHVRYTLDGWLTYADLQATYVRNSCDGFSDKFSFLLYAHTIQIGQRLDFAVRFQCKGAQFWDSNRGKNYTFQCLPASVDPMLGPVPLSPDFHTFY